MHRILSRLQTSNSNNANILRVLQIAFTFRYCLDRLKSMCVQQLCSKLSVENVCDLLRIADQYCANKLRTKALDIIHKNQQLILNHSVRVAIIAC